MRIHPRQATAALNLLAVAAVVYLYYIDRMAVNPVAAIPDRSSALQTSDIAAPKMPFDRLEAGIKMTNMRLPAPPPALSAMPMPQAPVSQSSANKQILSEPAPPPEPALKPLAPQLARDKKATIMPTIAPPINLKPAKSKPAAVKPLTVSPRQSKPIALASLAAPLLPQTIKAPALRPMAVTSLTQKPSSQARVPLIVKPQDIHISQVNLLKGQQTLDMVANIGGLDMEIFWPDTAHKSAYLYDVMTRCFGMRSAVLDREGEILSTAGRGEANHAGLSPLLRQLKQPASRGEADVIAEIVAQHRVSGAYTPVRIFTKSVDARLVDGIAQLTGKPIGPNSVLRANYVIDRAHIFVANITHNGARAAGRVLLVDGGC
jgi:hypothetical protein